MTVAFFTANLSMQQDPDNFDVTARRKSLELQFKKYLAARVVQPTTRKVVSDSKKIK